MSLDVTIRYKEPKLVDYNSTHAACGSTYRVCADDSPVMEESWSANVTHNMGRMACEIPLEEELGDKEGFEVALYEVVWRPDEIWDEPSTDLVLPYLIQGICYMVCHRRELEKFNPENGWGNYDSFLGWLIAYKNACEDNPGCLIEASR